MSHIGRPSRPPPSPCQTMLAELDSLWAVAELLSKRLAALEARPQAVIPRKALRQSAASSKADGPPL
jgi:hypothetical protein